MQHLKPGHGMETVAQMDELCLNLLTRVRVSAGLDPLERIWSLEHWLASLDRVKAVTCHADLPDYQSFCLVFDAGRSTPDRVEVERFRRDKEIEVVHRVPPPGIQALSALWWTEEDQGNVLFAKRKILLDEKAYSPAVACKMFGMLRENLEKLLGKDVCVLS